ncbi:MAG: DUF58 domain-containing protein [Planctomycetes bacterium]|nr:DUF58 domain-containing protein [Planctomycetota bacterium]
MVPTPRLWFLIGVAAAPFAAAIFVPGVSMLGWIADALLLAAWGVDLALTDSPGALKGSIAVNKVASLGIPESIRIELRNSGGARGRATARLVVPESWTVPEAPVTFELIPRAAARLRFSAVPRRRGRHTVGPLFVRYRSFLGLFQRDARCAVEAQVKVYPAVHSIKEYQILVRRLRVREMGFRPQRLRGQGMEFARLREYHHDDDPRVIDWKATARHGRVISREYQAERGQTVFLMIDAGRMLTAEVDGLVKIDYALHGALLLARVAAEYDDRVGALVFTDRLERVVPPRKGRAAVAALAEALFDVEAKLCEPDYDAAFARLQVIGRKRALVVLFTNLVDQETSALLRGYVAVALRRHVVMVVALGDRQTRDLADAMPETEEEGYRKAAACRLLAAREATLQGLARQGVQVLHAPAGRIPVALVNRYLDFKARRLW